jgi:hypothetical protein
MMFIDFHSIFFSHVFEFFIFFLRGVVSTASFLSEQSQHVMSCRCAIVAPLWRSFPFIGIH